jgi:hypothetical protein
LFGQRLQHCAEKDHPHCYEEAKISGQPDLFMLSALQILFSTSRKHLITTLPIFTRSLALPLALDRVSPGKYDSGLKRRGSFSSVKDLQKAIGEFLTVWNENPKPFVWTATVESIQQKLAHCRQTLEQIHPGCTQPRKRKTLETPVQLILGHYTSSKQN